MCKAITPVALSHDCGTNGPASVFIEHLGTMKKLVPQGIAPTNVLAIILAHLYIWPICLSLVV